MRAVLHILRAAPLSTVQDAGRFGMLRHGISASGPMDRASFEAATGLLDEAGSAGIEFTMAGFDLTIERGECRVGFAGGGFCASVNGTTVAWPGTAKLRAGDRLTITPGTWGNYGYLRFDGEVEVPEVMGRRATSTRNQFGGLEGRSLTAGDRLTLSGSGVPQSGATLPIASDDRPIRVIWGLHADLFDAQLRQQFLRGVFKVSSRLDRMGVRLDDPQGVFEAAKILSLVSDAVVPGDIQILGDGTPIVLMRDHQPTGGYPRIATVISADLDRFAQMRPGTSVVFAPVTVEHAQRILRSGGP